MKKICLLLMAAFSIHAAFAQNTLKGIVKDDSHQEKLPMVTIRLQGTNIGTYSDADGAFELKNIPDGRQIIIFNYVGYQERRDTLIFPLKEAGPKEFFLTPMELDEVVITSTRTSRTIDNIPTRVETISGEELAEKGNMKPGNIRMLLNESTGIQTQQTSATSYNSSIRIQGLEGKYTQVLRDGFQLYSGFSGGLSLLQIAPLDLQQVEVIKGASSTLYGEGAIAGIVNLISKVPREKRELSFMLNGTSALGLDASGFYSQKFKKIGATVFASYNLESPYDPAGIGLTAIPQSRRFTLSPKLFYYFNDKTSMYFGLSEIAENREGGDMKYIKGEGDSIHSYFEKNLTNRFSTQAEFDRKMNDKSAFTLKNSFSHFNRSMEVPAFAFSGVQLSSFTEGSFDHKGDKMEWTGGLNLLTDRFEQSKPDSSKPLDYAYITYGAFLQNTWTATGKFSLETGLRADYHNKYGLFILPRLSALLKLNQKLAMRLGGGLGYKTPAVFTEDAEKIQFRNVLPLDFSILKAERSLGLNYDINYKLPLPKNALVTFNLLLFYTKVNDPIVLMPLAAGFYEYQQKGGFIDTKGAEVNAKLSYKDFKLFTGYTLADVHRHDGGKAEEMPLVARHRLNNVLMYEIEDKLKIGLEGYYYSRQKLNDGTAGKPYWLFGLMAEKMWGHISLFINFENFTDTRQTRFDSIYTGSITHPVFTDIYAPVDGFVINGGIKLKL